MISTITAGTNVEVKPATAATMLQDFVDGLTWIWSGAAAERMDVTGARNVAAAYFTVGTAVGSKVTRSRLQSDPSAEPMLGIWF